MAARVDEVETNVLRVTLREGSDEDPDGRSIGADVDRVTQDAGLGEVVE